VRTTRVVLFGLLGATVAAVVALIITSEVGKGPAHTFELVPQASATDAELRSDAGTMVTRLENLGYTTQAQVENGSIQVTMYGSEQQLRSGVVSSLMQGRLFVRPVECSAPLYDPNANRSAPVALKCEKQYAMTASALKVNTDTGRTTTIPPQPNLAAVPSSVPSAEPEGDTVIVPAGPNSGFAGKRLVLGPASLSNSAISSAQASVASGAKWSVDVTLTSDSSDAYDVLTEDQFHALVAYEVDGTVVSAPVIEPTLKSYGDLGATFEIQAAFTKSEAVALANSLTSPLAVPLRLSGSDGS
jgi:hypothetical protein